MTTKDLIMKLSTMPQGMNVQVEYLEDDFYPPVWIAMNVTKVKVKSTLKGEPKSVVISYR